MENNQRNSRKRLNSLILLVAFTAVMLIVSTYAWFSTQRNVTLDGIKGTVKVAEGLQISLDGQTWVNTINFSDFDQTTENWTLKTTGATGNYFAEGVTGASFATPRGTGGGITNVIPTQFLPVSTDGKIETGATGITMYAGELEGNSKLKGIATKAEAAASGYFAFDVFLMNTSGTKTADEELHLDKSSAVVAGNTTSGAENTARVGFALYANDGADAANVAGTRDGVAGIAPENGEGVLGATDGALSKVAIWEPNVDQHTSSIVGKFKNVLIKTTTPSATYYPVTDDSDGSTKPHTPTFALTAKSVEETKNSIKNIYDWSGTDTVDKDKLAEQLTVKTVAAGVGDAVKLTSAADSSDVLKIGANQYHKMRIYIWMEGQDVDCLNEASFGKYVEVDVGINKPDTNAS